MNGIISTNNLLVNVPAMFEASGNVTSIGGADMNSLTHKRSGVYAITNTVNGNQYIGSAVELQNRWQTHRQSLRKGTHHSVYLQRAWSKYGEDCFTFSVLEYCEKGKLIQREQFYFDNLSPKYNTAKIAGNTLGVKHTDDAKQKMSKTKSAMYVGSGNPRFGKPHSEESKRKMSEKRKGVIRPLEVIERARKTFLERFPDWISPTLGGKIGKPKSKYYGVSSCVEGEKQYWHVRLTVNKKRVYLGMFKDEVLAAKTYDKYVIENNLPYPLNFSRGNK
jgi:group I intron endonuclease